MENEPRMLGNVGSNAEKEKAPLFGSSVSKNLQDSSVSNFSQELPSVSKKVQKPSVSKNSQDSSVSKILQDITEVRSDIVINLRTDIEQVKDVETRMRNDQEYLNRCLSSVSHRTYDITKLIDARFEELASLTDDEDMKKAVDIVRLDMLYLFRNVADLL